MTNIDERHSHEGRTAFHIAVHWKWLLQMEYLLANGACLDARDKSGQTALHMAAKVGDKEVVKWLLDHGADPAITDEQSQMSWMLALNDNHSDIVELLLSVHSYDCEGELPLGRHSIHYACVAGNNGNKKVVKYLLDKGVNINVKSRDGMTALVCAANHLYKDMVRFLVENGADINIPDPEGTSVAMKYLDNDRVFSTDLEWLIQHGADLNTVNKDGCSMLHTAASILQTQHAIDNENIVHKLLQANIDVRLSEVCGPNGNTPVLTAVKARNAQLVRLLVNACCSLKHIQTWLRSEDRANIRADDDFNDTVAWLEVKVSGPLRLEQLCRLPILATMGHSDLQNKLTKLPIPTFTQSFMDPRSYLKMCEEENKV